MLIDLEKIVNGLVASFIGGWWSWVTFNLLKARRDIDAAHRNIRKVSDARTDPATVLDKDSNTNAAETANC